MRNPAHISQYLFWDCFEVVVAGHQSALEVGCAEGNNLRYCPASVKVGIELHEPYTKPDGTVQFLLGDALSILPTLQDNQFELGLLIDIVEHFPKPEAHELLKHMDRIISKTILLWIPEGECVINEQYHDNFRPWTPGLEHKSYWEVPELEALGYDVARWPNYHVNHITKERTIGALFCVKTR